MASNSLPQKSPRFTQIQQVSSTQGYLSPGSTIGKVNAHVLENAFFHKTQTFSATTSGNPISYLSVPKPSSICNFKITATISQVVPSISSQPWASRQFIQYASTSGNDISTSIEYDNFENLPYDYWFYDASISEISFTAENDGIVLYLPLRSVFPFDMFFLIQGVIKTFVTPYIPTP